MAVLAVTDTSFEAEVLRSELPVLIDFYADWCAPCRTIAPIVAWLAEEHDGALKVVNVDVDQNPRIASAFQIRSIPTLVVMKEGQVVERITGAVPKATLAGVIEKVIETTGTEKWEPQKLHEAIVKGRVVAVDLRAASDFRRAHLPGAINMPPEERADRLASLDDGKRYVLYARTDDTVVPIVKQAASQGLRVGYLTGGLLSWETVGLPIERAV